MKKFSLMVFLAVALRGASSAEAALTAAPAEYELLAHTNLVAWCIVPFDAKKRGPEERATMLEKLGFRFFAYDYRAEHIPTFDAEMDALQRHGIQLTAWWFPGVMNDEARLILDVLHRHKIRAQLWVTSGGAPVKSAAEQNARVKAEAKNIQAIAEAAAKAGCTVALYNHENWFGEPENQIQIIEQLKRDGVTNVGIVYNLHHGHDHVDRLPALLQQMKPYLLALNLNGMTKNGDQLGKKILPLGQGELDLSLLRMIRDSGWRGPIGLLNHTDEDAEARLRDNLDGLDWLVRQIDGQPPGPRPVPRSWHEPAPPGSPKKTSWQVSLAPAFSQALSGGIMFEGKPEYRARPITIECRARLDGFSRFNILVASDTKASAEHWELYSFAGTGALSLYQPGRGGNVSAEINICDGQWHYLAAIIEEKRVRLFVDGKLVKDAVATPLTGTPIPGGFAIGTLVEGGIGCDGLVDDVRLSRGAREIVSVRNNPLARDDQTIGLWNFDDLKPSTSGELDPWAIENAHARAALPEFQEIPAATLDELTPAQDVPGTGTITNWHRSLGDATSSRFSALNQINSENVHRLEVAWTYHSKDGTGNIQCNPIIVNGVMFAPTAGHFVVAVNAETGEEIWRFKPEIKTGAMRQEDPPARRGLIFWPGNNKDSPRILFTSGNWIYALDPKTGKPVEAFGDKGRTFLPAGGTVAGAIFKNFLVVPGFNRDVFGYDVRSGELLWTFHTIPHTGEYGRETWSGAGEGANCWGGMALDEQRGIAFISTGSPKPNFTGGSYRGENIFANCLLALDVATGIRLWHFQEIRHDIWDLDIPAPPNLVTLTREGKRVDAVAQVTKLGNTLLLDRLTGKPIFPFRLRRAPTSKLPGEWTAPYQPDVQIPEPFARQEFSTREVSQRSDEAREYVGKRIASANFGWFEPFQEGKATVLYNIHGGAEWTGAAFDPGSGFLYVSANEIPWAITVFRDDPELSRDSAAPTAGEKIYQQTCGPCHGADRIGLGVAPPLRGLRHRLKEPEVLAIMKSGRNLMPAAPALSDIDKKALMDFLFLRDRPLGKETGTRPERPAYTFNGYPKLLDLDGYPGNKPPWGTLNCIDLNTGKIRWKIPLGEYPELTAQGIPQTGTENFGGAIVTAGGLVFCSGTRDRKIRAFNKENGKELWSHTLPLHGTAIPATYEVNGRQFVVLAATGGGKLGGPTGDAYVAFALPRKP
ncbi:MAG: PQQ-binding-like beta-propeller repeat protein [Verrucomicrobiota bacterium]